MSATKSSLLFSLLLLFVALDNIQTAAAVLPFETEDLNVKQWTTISPQFKTWNGFWVRYDTSAKPILTSMVMRNFTYLDASTVLHTTSYRNPKVRNASFVPSGIFTETMFKNPKSISASLYFYPTNWGVSGSRQLVAKSSAVEKFFIHRKARVSCMPIYENGRLSQVSIFRERIHPGSVTSSEVLGVRTKSLRGNSYVLTGAWARVQECIDKDYRYSKDSSGLFRDFEVLLPTGDQRYAYSFAWGFSISLPKTVGARDPFAAYFMWRVSPKKLITGYTKYGTSGTFEKDCSSTFSKIETWPASLMSTWMRYVKPRFNRSGRRQFVSRYSTSYENCCLIMGHMVNSRRKRTSRWFHLLYLTEFDLANHYSEENLNWLF